MISLLGCGLTLSMRVGCDISSRSAAIPKLHTKFGLWCVSDLWLLVMHAEKPLVRIKAAAASQLYSAAELSGMFVHG